MAVAASQGMSYYLGGPACLQHRGRDQLTWNELMTEEYKAPPDPEQQELPDGEAEIIDYYNALAAQHPGQCVFHAPTSEEN